MPADFIVLPKLQGEPKSVTEKPLLGLTLEERARLMLLASGLRPAQGLCGNKDLILYPAELVGPTKLGYEIAGTRTAEGEVVALLPQDGGRPVLRVSKAVRSAIFQGVESVDQAYEKARAVVSRREPLRTIAVAVRNKESRKNARAVLLGSLRKSVDGLISRTINRPISIAVSSLLVHTPVTPNMMTVVTFFVAIVASVLMALQHFVIGALLLQLSSILDGCDGEIARLKYKTSKLGAWLDTILDDISTPTFAVCTGYGAWKGIGGELGAILLGMAIACVVLSIPGYWVTYSRLLAHGHTDTGRVSFSDTPNPGWFRRFLLRYLMPFSKRDGYIFIFMVTALAGFGWMIVVLYFIGVVLVIGTILTDRSPSHARYGTTQQHRPITVSSSGSFTR